MRKLFVLLISIVVLSACAPVHRFTQTMVNQIVFLLARKNLLAHNIYARSTVEKVSIARHLDVSQNRAY